MAVSNSITAVLNFIALMSSIPIISTGIWLSTKQDNQCFHWLRFPLVFIGILFLLVTLAGFVGACWNKQGLLAFFLFSMAFLIVSLLILLVLAFIVARPSGAYPDAKLDQQYASADAFFAAHLSPIQSGCCKPPTICGYQYVNPTMWINPVNQIADADCPLWNNDPSQLCYNCDSCKAGLLGNLRREWRKANVVLIIVVVVLIWVYLIACCAYKNAQTEDLFRRYKQGWT